MEGRLHDAQTFPSLVANEAGGEKSDSSPRIANNAIKGDSASPCGGVETPVRRDD